MATKKTSGTTSSPERPTLYVPLNVAQHRVNIQIDKGRAISSIQINSKDALDAVEPQYRTWRDYTEELLNQIATPNTLANDFVGGFGFLMLGSQSLREEIQIFHNTIRDKLEKLESIRERLELLPIVLPVAQSPRKTNTIDMLDKYLRRFQLVARQLRQRYNGRDTLEISDEYDVQNLLHALLRLFFDDIRTEEWTPSYAGGASRMDFLLKSEKVVIEVKKTRKGLADKEVGSQLLEDTLRYQNHQDCQHLVCFIYDPDSYINNPRGLEHDLSRSINGMPVKAIVTPQ